MPKLITLLAFACLVAVPPARAQFEANVLPEMTVRRAAGPITVDGRLDDAGWSGTAAVDHFQRTFPDYNVEPEIGLQAWMTYDDETLYFAIVSTEDPSSVRASMRDRDDIFRDDYVGLIVDTYGSGAWAYEFFINPYGLQGDLRWTPTGEDGGFDVVWESEGRITETGWQVEVAIPFRSLRFPDRFEQEWRANFWYNRARASRERYSWSAADRDDPCWPCTWGTIRGIEGVSSGGAIELLPSLTGFRIDGLADRGDPTSDFGEIDSDADFGIGARVGLSSSMSVEATYNPDFSQVESDAAQIDANTTFALFFPERRPFFQEGSDLYSSYLNAVYTRSINDPLWASKFTARAGGASGGLLVGRDENSPLIVPSEERSVILSAGKSTSLIGRGRFTRDDGSFVGALGTLRSLDDGGQNTVFGADGMLRFLSNFQIESQWLFSNTEERDDSTLGGNAFAIRDFDDAIIGERTFKLGDDVFTERLDGENFWGHAGYVSLERDTRYWDFDFDYYRTSNGFRADNGFITQNDNQRVTLINTAVYEANNAYVDQVRPFFMVGRIWNIDGQRKDEWIRPELNLDLKGQTGVEAGLLFSNEWFGGEELRGIYRWNLELGSRFSEYFNFDVEYERGDFVARRARPVRLGDGQRLEIGMTIKPPIDFLHLDRLTIQPDFEWQQLRDPRTGSTDQRGFFEGYVLRTRLNFQATRDFFARVIVQYDEFDREIDIEPLLTYRIDPFTLIYVGATTRLQDFSGFDEGSGGNLDLGYEETERQWFLKLQAQLRS